jgi:PAS domain S-box-containing protein
MQDSSLNALPLQPSLAQLKQMFEFSSHLIFLYNCDLKKLVFVNNRVTEKLGYTLSDIQQMGESVFLLIEHPNKNEFLQEIEAKYGALKEGENTEFSCEILHKNGEVRMLRNRSLVLVQDSPQAPRMIMNVAEDITDLLEREGDLLRRQYQLERRLTALNKSNRDLEQFAYIASHDLQEPLRKIIAFGERLDKKYKEQLGTEGQFFVDRMTSAAQRMHSLIEDLLAYSRASRHTESYVLVNLNEVIKNVLEDLEVKIQDKKASITVVDLPILEAQSVQMHQLFLNLIENALKFTKVDTSPIIKIDVRNVAAQEASKIGQLNPKENYFEFTISDNGIGFEPEYAERIFTIFQRLHGRAEYAGTGLGLAICRKIVETHHGFIEAEGKPHEGAKFVFYLPATQPNIL